MPSVFRVVRAKKDSVDIEVVKQNGTTFGKTIMAEELPDGTGPEIMEAIKKLIQAERARERNIPNLNILDQYKGVDYDDTPPVTP